MSIWFSRIFRNSWRISCVSALLLASVSAPLRAARAEESRGIAAKRDWRILSMVGVRYWTHYNRVRVISTPPDSVLGELSVSGWYRQTVGLRAAFAKSIAQSDAQIFSLGLDLPLITLYQKGKQAPFFNAFIFALSGDMAYYKIQAPVAPEDWPETGFVPRYGAKFMFGMKGSRFFGELQLLVTRLNNNFWIAPHAGLGINF